MCRVLGLQGLVAECSRVKGLVLCSTFGVKMRRWGGSGLQASGCILGHFSFCRLRHSIASGQGRSFEKGGSVRTVEMKLCWIGCLQEVQVL